MKFYKYLSLAVLFALTWLLVVARKKITFRTLMEIWLSMCMMPEWKLLAEIHVL